MSICLSKTVREPSFNRDAIEGYRQALNDLINESNDGISNRDLVAMGGRPMRIPKGRRRDFAEWGFGYNAGLLAATIALHDDYGVIFRARALWIRVNG